CTLVLRSLYVSRIHATLRYHGYDSWDENHQGYYELIDGNGIDLLSRNGILVNGKRVQRHQLCLGDEIDLSPDVHLQYTINPSDLERLVMDTEESLQGSGGLGGRVSSELTVALSDVTLSKLSKLSKLWRSLQDQAPRSPLPKYDGTPQVDRLPSYETLRLRSLEPPTRPVKANPLDPHALNESVICVYPDSYTGENDEAVIMLKKNDAYHLMADPEEPQDS
ncbi:FHA domain-containing protein, partial [Prochlorothrix hollandica]|uniref:FHA domain-containing protein n=1 Tax=Prochlorothrix hollandica TaxID=1223 RepID=UPI00333E8FF9